MAAILKVMTQEEAERSRTGDVKWWLGAIQRYFYSGFMSRDIVTHGGGGHISGIWAKKGPGNLQILGTDVTCKT